MFNQHKGNVEISLPANIIIGIITLIVVVIFYINAFIFLEGRPNGTGTANPSEDSSYSDSDNSESSEDADATVAAETTDDSNDSTLSENSTVSDNDLPGLSSDQWFYYNTLNEEEKNIYAQFMDMYEHPDVLDYSFEIDMDNYEWERIDSISYMVLCDHPEFFYIKNSRNKKDERFEFLSKDFEGHETLICTQKKCPDNELEMIKNFEASADRFMADIDLSKPANEIELQIHDKLMDMVQYDENVFKSNDECNLAHTAYGAIVANSEGEPHTAVCDGYADAFQYLLGRAGINSIGVTGYGLTEEDQEPDNEYAHKWNLVYLDNEWYEVDACWDDIDLSKFPDGINPSVITDNKEAYGAATHHYYNLTTDNMTSTDPDPRDTFNIDGYLPYSFNPATTRHIRGEEKEFFNYFVELLPTATGTEYAY